MPARHQTIRIQEANMRAFLGWTFAFLGLLLGLAAAPVRAQAPAKSRTALASSPVATSKTAATPAKLPVRRIVLYKDGVGFFEHIGRVRGDQDVSIDFTSGQLNDVLNSLTILDLNSGRIAAVDYNSQAPLSRRLGALRLPIGRKTTVKDFLAALAGAHLAVRSPSGTITGRLLSVETIRRQKGDLYFPVDQISLVTDAGDVRTVDLGPSTSVHILSRDLNAEVGRYLGLLASARQQDLRRMVISTVGTGERQLYVSYISEVPIWKTTYRLVLPSKPGAKPLLQGWAIVDNTVGEDWDNVRMSLVAGAPQSFIQELSQPYYARRPVVPLPQSVQLTPQTHEATLLGGAGSITGTVTDQSGAVISNASVRVFDAGDNLMARTATDEQGRYEIGSLPAGSYRVQISSTGFQTTTLTGAEVSTGPTTLNAQLQVGSVAQAVEVTAPRAKAMGGVIGGTMGRIAGATPAPPAALGSERAADILNQARQAAAEQARGRALGDLFEYDVKEPVTIRKNQSALVPILQTPITAEKVSLWNPSLGSSRPLRAVWLTNSSSLTLAGGSFSVIEDETFAGEGLLDSIKPGEKRLLSYAVDLGVQVDTKNSAEPQRVTEVRIFHGVMTQTRQMRESTTYTVRNEDTSPRALVIEYPRRSGWKLNPGEKPAETTADYYRFRLEIQPKKTASLVVGESRPYSTTYSLSNLGDDQVAFFLRQRSINPEIEKALRRVLAQKKEVARLASEIAARQSDIQSLFTDQARIRENLKALKDSAGEKALIDRYTRQLGDQETRLETLRRQLAALQTQLLQAQQQLDAIIEQINMKVTL
jgi:hypothetical protein